MAIIALVEALKHQEAFCTTQAKYPALVAGFGAGKTYALVMRALHLKLKNPANDIACYEPTYGLIHDILLPAFRKFLEVYQIRSEYNTQHKTLQLFEYGKIIFRTLDDPEKIVGYEVGDSIIDEMDILKKDKADTAWIKIFARNRQKKANGETNTIGVTTTPEGFKFVYERWGMATDPDYHLINARTDDNPFLPADYVDGMIKSYDPSLLKAYREGQFVNLQHGQVFYGFNREYVLPVMIDTVLPVCLCVDFNVDPMCWTVAQFKSGNDIRACFEIVKRNTNTWEMIAEFKEHIGKHHKIIVYGDASGSARDTRSSYSDFAIIAEALSDYKFEFRVPAANPPVRDRINAMNSKLSSGAVLVSPSCVTLIRDMEQIVWKGSEMDKSDHDLTHAIDGFSYMVAYEFPIEHKRHVSIRNV